MAINTQSFTALVSGFAAAVQSAASSLVNFSIGSVLRAISEAVAGVALWLQGLIVQLLTVTRLSTSSGPDVDTFLADFGFARLPAKAASGVVTFSRMTDTSQAVVPVGALVQTADGTLQFQVIADTTNSAYSPTVVAGGGFIIPGGTQSMSCTVVCITPGPSGYTDASGNAQAGTISALAQAIPYVDTVTNAAAFTNGANPESDSAVKLRFQVWVRSLSEGTVAAVQSAILSLQQGVVCNVVENYSYAGSPQEGFFYAVIDDGTGYPSSTLLSTASNAIDAVRPITSTFAVHAPVVVTATVAMTITTAAGYTHSVLTAAAQAALASYINTLPLGASLPYTRLAQVAYDASPGITNVTACTLNSGTSDLTATAQQVIKLGSATVS